MEDTNWGKSTILVHNTFFTRADGVCHIPPIVVHQSSEFSADLLLHLPSDWIVHATPSGYMDRDGWYKAIRQFIKLSGAHPTNI